MRAAAIMRSLITADPELSEAFGSRVRTGHAGPIDARPYCLLYEIATQPVTALAGETEMDVTTVQIDVYADTHHEAGALAKRLRDVIAAFPRGNVADCFVNSLIRSDGPRQSAERIGTGSQDVIARVTIDYRLHHAELIT
jgi:hypothetical protein